MHTYKSIRQFLMEREGCSVEMQQRIAKKLLDAARKYKLDVQAVMLESVLESLKELEGVQGQEEGQGPGQEGQR